MGAAAAGRGRGAVRDPARPAHPARADRRRLRRRRWQLRGHRLEDRSAAVRGRAGGRRRAAGRLPAGLVPSDRCARRTGECRLPPRRGRGHHPAGRPARRGRTAGPGHRHGAVERTPVTGNDRPSWLGDTRESYDTVAADYADLLHDELAARPPDRAVLAAFARLVHADGSGPVADVGCGPGRITAHLAALGVPVRGIDLSPFVRKTTAEVPRPDLPDPTGEADVLTVVTGSAP